MNAEYRFIEPVDVLYLRGNRLFGEGGEHAEALMPPWPSLFAGALRSRILVDRGVNLASFAQKGEADDDVIRILGTPKSPGPFRIAHVSLARRINGGVEWFMPVPSDVVIFDRGTSGSNPKLEIHRLAALDLTAIRPVVISNPGPRAPLLRAAGPGKPEPGYLISMHGWLAYLQGKDLSAEQFIHHSKLWKNDRRLGIALNFHSRTAAEGRIYTTDAVAMCKDCGFLVGVQNSGGLLPANGLIRLGGDGRGASMEKISSESLPEYLPHGPIFRMILMTPGVFADGWIPPGLIRENGDFCLSYRGFKARLVASAVSRYEVASGWDIAAQKPKPALRLTPAGSVYWFERLGGDICVLKDLLEEGLWPLIAQDPGHAPAAALESQRRAEGFNNVWFGE